MRQRICSLVLVAFASLGLGSTGCVSQKILRFEDHPKFPVTRLELSVAKNFYVYRTFEHRFYLCNDAGDKLMAVLRSHLEPIFHTFPMGCTLNIEETPKDKPGTVVLSYEGFHNSLRAVFGR